MASRVTIKSIIQVSGTNAVNVQYVIPKVRKLWPQAIIPTYDYAMIYYQYGRDPSLSDYSGYYYISDSNPADGNVHDHTFNNLRGDSEIHFMLYVVLHDTNQQTEQFASFSDYDTYTIIGNTKSRYMVKIKDPSDNSTWVDVTQYIEMSTYEVNRNPQVEEWEDGGWNKHIEVPNYRIEGEFKVLLYDRTVYNTFINLVNKNRVAYGGCVWMKVQVNNEMDPKTSPYVESQMPELYKAFFKMEYSPVWNMPILGIKEIDSIEVKIEEVEHNALPVIS